MKTVIFDYDGVLVNSLKLVFEIYKEISKKLHKVEFKTARQLADSFDGDWKKLYKTLGITNKREEAIASGIYAHAIMQSLSQIPVIPHISDVLKDLSKSCKMAIVTNTLKQFIAEKLTQADVASYFSTIVDYNDTKRKKPEPDQIIECMNRLGSKPENTFYIGDMTADIIAGKRAGVKTIAVTWGWHSKEALAACSPDYIANTPQELLQIIGS